MLSHYSCCSKEDVAVLLHGSATAPWKDGNQVNVSHFSGDHSGEVKGNCRYTPSAILITGTKHQMPPGVLCSSFIQGRNLKPFNSSNSNVEKWRLIMGKEEKGLLAISNTTILLFMFNWKYYTLYTNLKAHTERLCIVSTNLSRKRSHYHFLQTTKAGYRNTWHIRFQRYELK